MNSIIISNQKELDKKKRAICADGIEKLHFLSDFDRTLTQAFIDNERIPSAISILRNGNYLTPDYAEKAHALFNYYYPIEINVNISLEEKRKAMRKWWAEHFELIIKSGLNKKDLEKISKSKKIKLRKGAKKLINSLNSHNIPLIIMSSCGIGNEFISMYLKEHGILHNNIHIISNAYEWDENGKAIAVKQPIIHGGNKNEVVIKNFAVFELIKNRKNVLLLGDSLGDTEMINGFDYDNLIKIGFLNENVKENLEEYKKNYDVVILNDGSMEYVNDLLNEINI
ncbi:MAG: hypothetical protein V1768_03095 [Patescibacteria group bacterium]|nr:hypothetical protein [Patescibacteria group bacterium]MBU1778206.1 hypothetical protein [Patescibacteria group bacterium]MBU2474561.1 hypothetical protein [Patescibacteria group bacterium]